MKAVIMAGGEGVRLQPICSGRPKPMVPLLDRPVMEHLIALLSRHGITQIGITLHHHARTVKEYFGDGSRLGVSVTYFEEDVPLGTAGGVKNCEEYLEGETFLVLSGDIVTDLDLTAAIEFHRQKNAVATLVTCAHPCPLEYGLVLADEQGKVLQFVEKPSWGQTVSSMVSAGIYVLEHRVLDRIPRGRTCDFGRDVFPAMLEAGETLYACHLTGYWQDVGDCGDYLACSADALSGKLKLDMQREPLSPGIWSAHPIPEGVSLIPPCWIGEDVQIGNGSLIGPHVVLGKGSRVGRRSLVQRSVLQGAQVGDRATLYGAVLCSGSSAGDETVLNEGAVLGENARVKDRGVLMERVRLWPGRAVQEGCRQTHSVAETGRSDSLRFGDGGVIRGTLGEDMDAEALLALGSALSGDGKVGLGGFGGAGADMLLRAAASGITAGGGMVLHHDMQCAAQAAWLAESCQLPVSLFIEQDGEKIYLHLFDSGGLPLGRRRERKLEFAMQQGRASTLPAGGIGSCEHLSTGVQAYARDAARRTVLRRMPGRTVRVAVAGDTPANRAVRAVLEELGCVVVDQWRRGIPAFMAGHGGFRLTARDESGALLSPQQLLAVATLVEMEHGGGRVAVPDDASAAVELIAAGFGKSVLRLGRDGEQARQLYRNLPWLRDAAFAAARLCARMGATGERLEQLVAKTPRFSSWKREVPVSRDRGEIMGRMAAQAGRDSVLGEGIRLRAHGGWVYLVPLARRAALKIVAESADLEVAAELCDFYAGQIAKLDGRPGTK